jgi:radical SAM protein with 4Fe4S-binding SPASM domain
VNNLRQSPRPVKGRCAGCRFLSLCGGGFRVRAWQRFGDPLAEDPGCYLDQAEIAAEIPLSV